MAMLPVIDTAKLSDSSEKRNLLEASRHWGSFRVINHGIPASLQSEMKAAVKALFELPDDVKRRNVDIVYGSGYRGPGYRAPDQIQQYESLGVYDAASPTDVDAFCSLLDAPNHVRETITTYVQESHKVIVDIATKLAESMGLMGDQNFGEWQCQLRIIRYNFTQDSVGSEAGPIHTDGAMLTLIQEDESIGGLEILDPDSGSYVEDNPVPAGTLVVNVGDVAQAWSNGVLNNVKHRVFCKAAGERFTIALFLMAPKDDNVEAPAAFIDSDHPRIYKTFKLHDHRKSCVLTGLRAGELLSTYLCNRNKV